MPTAFIDSHYEDDDDGNSVHWPDANGATYPGLAINAGDIIVANLGNSASYVSSDGTVTITFGAINNGDGTFTAQAPSSGGTSSATTSSYSGPYAAISSAVSLEDDNFADIELLDTADQVKDPHTGEYPTHGRSGHKHIHGGHLRPSAVGHRHAHPHNAHRYDLHNIVFIITGSNQTAGTDTDGSSYPGTCSVAWQTKTTNHSPTQTGKIRINNGSTVYTINDNTAAPLTGIPAGRYIVYDTSVGGTAFTTMPASTDFTLDANIKYMIVGKISETMDDTSLQYWTSGHHPGAHQVHGIHLAQNVGGGTGTIGAGSINPYQLSKYNKQKHYYHNLKFKITASNSTSANCSFGWVASSGAKIQFEDNTSIAVSNSSWAVGSFNVDSSNPMTAVPAGSFIVWDTGATTPGFAWLAPSNATLILDSQTRFIILGTISSVVDAHTRQYYFQGFHIGSHEIHGKHKAKKSSGRTHQHPHKHHAKHRSKHVKDSGATHKAHFMTAQ